MTRNLVVKEIFREKAVNPTKELGQAFAPTNIALIKYWGKRDSEINLPVTSSLSISLGDRGAQTTIREIAANQDSIFLNQRQIDLNSQFGKRLVAFLDLFRPSPTICYQVDTEMNIPVAAGLASSACGFAALILALNELYGWELAKPALSILARLGSGSAARSIWPGFVEWRQGEDVLGMDSHGLALSDQWRELKIGLHLLNTQQKPVSSREAMNRTVLTSRLYSAWPAQVSDDLQALKKAIVDKNFEDLGKIAEANALAMHATMMSAWPPVIYSQPETISAMHFIWQLRAAGLPVYFTQDAGPNLKLIFLESATRQLLQAFPNLEICTPFPL